MRFISREPASLRDFSFAANTKDGSLHRTIVRADGRWKCDVCGWYSKKGTFRWTAWHQQKGRHIGVCEDCFDFVPLSGRVA